MGFLGGRTLPCLKMKGKTKFEVSITGSVLLIHSFAVRSDRVTMRKLSWQMSDIETTDAPFSKGAAPL